MSETSSALTSPTYSMYQYMPMDIKEEEPKREKRKYRCRRRSPATIERARTVRRDKANARERKRMNSLNDALEHLRTILPQLPDEPKMTKIETLKVAQGYIQYLSAMLSGESPPAMDFSSLLGSREVSMEPFQDSPHYPTGTYHIDNHYYYDTPIQHQASQHSQP